MGNCKSTSGEGAYKINLTPNNWVGGGSCADVYAIQKLSNKKFYAAKFFKVPLPFIEST